MFESFRILNSDDVDQYYRLKEKGYVGKFSNYGSIDLISDDQYVLRISGSKNMQKFVEEVEADPLSFLSCCKSNEPIYEALMDAYNYCSNYCS